ncbi:hypothetical protein FS837_000551, partial [Tulasnella sp. UAMH 9824]
TPRHSAPWIEKFTLEGRVLLYAGSTRPGLPIKWVIQFDPYSGRHITRHGDQSSTRERAVMDGDLLNILLFGGMAQPPSVLSIPAIFLNAPAEMVKESNKLAITNDSFDLTITTSHLSPFSLHGPDVTPLIDYQGPSIVARAAVIELDGSTNLEDLAAPDLLGERSSAETIHEAVPANVPENAGDSTSANHTSLTSQHLAWFGPTSGPLLHEQRPAVLPELRSLRSVLGERALQRHAQDAGENGQMEVKVENATVEEDAQQDEVHQRRKRRGGKRIMAWKNKRRQEKEDRERDPKAGPSGQR